MSDDDLREKYAVAIHEAYWEGDDEDTPASVWKLADAVLAVRDAEVERLRARLAAVGTTVLTIKRKVQP